MSLLRALVPLTFLLLAAVAFVGARRKQLRYFLVVLGLVALAFALIWLARVPVFVAISRSGQEFDNKLPPKW